MPSPIRVLSLTQPWAWLIVNGYKDIENRTWHTKYRGWCYIHASKGMTHFDYATVVRDVRRIAPEIKVPDRTALDRGGVIGAVRFTDCVTTSTSPWFFGPYGFEIAEARAFESMIPMRGHLGFFSPSSPLPALP